MLRARSGSALVVVIGTLALISVFAAIYISIGRADTRAVATQQSRAVQGDFADRYLEQAIEVVRDDRLDATMQFADALQRYQVPRRETTDAPYTDFSMRSQSNDPANWFFPKGGNPYTRQNGDTFDPRVPSDPFLASLRPEFLGDPAEPPFSNLSQGGTFLALDGFLDRRDWLQISNLAPDGRFVNLFNLRPQPGLDGNDREIGGFDAEPGWGSTDFGSSQRIRRMSEGLSLYRQQSLGDLDSPIESFDPLTDGFWMPGFTLPNQYGLLPPEIQNTPAIWSMYQRFALIPLDQPFVTYNRDGEVSTWADPDFPAYQWADADGDGFADSRWFELTEAREDIASSTSTPRDDVQRLYDAGEFRVFAAARVVDLSGMVNVNVARDSLNPPTAEYPLGLTPVDVDLRRLLTMQDQAEQFDGDINFANRDEPLSFAHLRRPAIENGVGRDWNLLPDSDYSRYRHFIEDTRAPLDLDPGRAGENGFPTAPSTSQREFPNAMLIGRYAASAIHESVVRNVTLPAIAGGALSFQPGGIIPPDDLILTEGSPLQRYDPLIAATSFNDLNEQRVQYYQNVGSLDPTRLDEAGVRSFSGITTPGSNGKYFGMGHFGLDDLAELLTYHGLNDPEVTSRLESAAQGRFKFALGTGDERYSPLMSTRPLSLDRSLHGQIAVSRTNPNRGSEVTGEISRESMALMTLSPRTKLSTLTGAVPMSPAGVAGIAGRGSSELSPSGLTLSDNAAVSFTDLTTDVNSAFEVYYRALAGELEVFRLKRASGVDGLPSGIVNAVWDPDLSEATVRDNPYSTLFYGHRGPELALRIAAHAAVNAKDLFDDDDNPTYATLVLNHSSTTRTLVDRVIDDADFGTIQFDLENSEEALLFPGLGGLLDPDQDVERERRVLPDGQGFPDQRQIVNVIGVEPTPVITEVSSMFVYTDASTTITKAGDTDSSPSPRPGRPIPLPGSIEQITINPELAEGNSDLLMQVLAVQLTNPWDVPISLGGGSGPDGLMWRVNNDQNNLNQPFNANSNLEFNYYIEFNGRFFKLGEYRDYIPPVAAASGTDYQLNDRYANSRGPTFPDNGAPLTQGQFPELEYRSVVLSPGESRVFYATAHTQLYSDATTAGLDQHWREVVDSYGDIPEEFLVPVGTNGENNDIDSDGLFDGFDNRGWTGLAQDWLAAQLSVEQQRGDETVRFRSARIHPFDPTSGELVEGINTTIRPTPFVNLFTVPGDPASDFGMVNRAADSSQVRLWRKYAEPLIEEVPAVPAPRGNATTSNLIQNDVLVDRMYLSDPTLGPSQNYLGAARISGTGDREVPDTVSFAEGFEPLYSCSVTPGTLNVRNDNRGLTLVRWATVRRKETMRRLDNNDANREENIGKIDAYLLASRRDPMNLVTRSTNASGPDSFPDAFGALDVFDLCETDDPVRWDSPSEGIRGEVEYDTFVTPESFYQGVLGARAERRTPVKTLALHPRRKNPEQVAIGGIEGDRFAADELNQSTAGLLSLFELQGTPTPSELQPEIFLSDPRSSSGSEADELLGLRVGQVTDALRVMGIGPTYAPDPTRNPINNFEVVDEEWMTLSEAFAIALGFEDLSAVIPATDAQPDAVWFDTVKVLPAPIGVEYVLDDLRLRLDDYVSYLNLERGGEGEKAAFTFNPATPNNSDARRGTGVPMALGVLDSVRVFDPVVYPSSPSDTTELTLTSPIMGLVNVNTAPLDVLRLLPGLAPSAQSFRSRDVETSGVNPRVEWWAGSAASARAGIDDGIVGGASATEELGLGDPSNPFLSWNISPLVDAENNPDIAAGLAAYRDRVVAQPRARSDPRLFVLPGSPVNFGYASNFAEVGGEESIFDNRYGEQNSMFTFRSRSSIADVDGLRGTPGFGSLGEMLMASVRDDAAALTGVGMDLDFYRHLAMSQFGSDDLNLGVSGNNADAVSLSPNFVRSGSDVPDDSRAGSTPDDYLEALASAAGVMNMTTTRSDFFAVWMVVQGFRESDVASLRANDPLVPSFKRRYLMVLDRSNVLEPGDRPRIVLTREIPL